MDIIRSSPLSAVFSWFSPLVVKFALVKGGIEVQLYKNNQLVKNWRASMLHQVLPEQFIRYIDDNHIYSGAHPYPLIKQLCQYLLPFASKKLVIDSSFFNELEEVSQPEDFALTWSINHSTMCIEGHYEGADGYLGTGWFHKGMKIWSLKNYPSNAIDEQLRHLVVPLARVESLMQSIIPSLQSYLPTRLDFELITNFAVSVVTLQACSGRVTLALQSNYPQLLLTIQIPRGNIDVLFAHGAMICFPHRALTPTLNRLLQSRFITMEGDDVPLFIKEQLPALRYYNQISDDTAATITESNEIVSIDTLKPTFTLVHTYEHGVGKYTMTALYRYQQHTLDMNALVAARRRNQRFVQQCDVWFEWPRNASNLLHTIQQQIPQVLRAEEVMGFDTRRVAIVQNRPDIQGIRPKGATPIERGQSVFAQLRFHGLSGGIVGESTWITMVFINACEQFLRDNRQGSILWLVPSNKKSSVTRAISDTSIKSYVTVASLITLRDEPALLSHAWTLVIFQYADRLLEGSPQARLLFQLKWEWALTSVASKNDVSPALMRIVHIPEQYYEQFCARYLFDLEEVPDRSMMRRRAPGPNTAQPMALIDTQRVGVVQLNPATVSKLREESEQLRERLIVESQDSRELLSITLIPEEAPASREPAEAAVDVDEDWQNILQQWRPEHWELISLLCQEQSIQLPVAERKNRRPVSRLIDEINAPVDEQLGDLLIDPETQTISQHLQALAQHLVCWYQSSKGR